MYTVIGSAASRAFRVLWMLEELGLPYDHQPAPPRSDAVRALNPAGKIPVLVADGEALTDSVAIMQFLADRHGRFTHPCGTLERARQDGLTHMILDEMDACLWTAARHSFVLPEERRVPEVKASLRWEFERACARLSERLGAGPFLMGAEMTVPDFLLAHCGRWARKARFDIADPALERWLDRMAARPAFGKVAAM
jgi:glutathione S-transferase